MTIIVPSQSCLLSFLHDPYMRPFSICKIFHLLVYKALLCFVMGRALAIPIYKALLCFVIQYCSTADSICDVADLCGILKTTYGKSLLLMFVHYSKFMSKTKKNSDSVLQVQNEKHVVIVIGSQFTLVHSLQQQWLAERRRRRGWGQGEPVVSHTGSLPLCHCQPFLPLHCRPHY